MFRKMRRIKQELAQDENIAILNKGTTGVLSVIGDNDYPYTIPLNYLYEDSKIYFHCAKQGHKIDAIKRNNKVSFCVIDKDELHPEKYTTFFKSVIVFGKARIIENPCELRPLITNFTEKFVPDDGKGTNASTIERSLKSLAMIEITIEHISGKQAIELVKPSIEI